MNRLAWLAAIWLVQSASAASLSISECRGAHGERVFSDRADCVQSAVRQVELPPPPAYVPPPAPDRQPGEREHRRGGRVRAAGDARESFLCTSPTRSWYQHTPCRGESGRGGKRESVRQQRVARTHACREIARPAAALRRGNERDERAGPYDKAMGRDPCR